MYKPEIKWKMVQSPPDLSDFAESFWMLTNPSDAAHEIVVLPDGRFDIIFSYSANEPFHATLRGLDTRPDSAEIPAQTVMFAVSFKLLAIEYLLQIAPPSHTTKRKCSNVSPKKARAHYIIRNGCMRPIPCNAC